MVEMYDIGRRVEVVTWCCARREKAHIGYLLKDSHGVNAAQWRHFGRWSGNLCLREVVTNLKG